jgi:hypothetical protein
MAMLEDVMTSHSVTQEPLILIEGHFLHSQGANAT